MIIGFENLQEVREKHHEDTIVFAGGVFDLMHPGHLDLFRHMRSVGHVAVVAVSTDERVRERKGDLRPIQDEATRLTMVGAVRDVDYALLAPGPSPDREVPTLQVIRALRPDIFMTCEVSWLQYENKVAQHGTETVIIPRFSEDISTTETINKIVRSHAEALTNVS